MTPGRNEAMTRQVAVGLLVALLAAGAGCTTTLQGGLDEAEANEMILVLAEVGIEADKSEAGAGGRWRVQVDRGDLSRAWRALRAAGLPRPRHAGFREVYRERALVPGRMEEQAVYLSALQEEIAQTLETVEGVVSARVHVTLRSASRLDKSRTGSSASVLLSFRLAAKGARPISEPAVQNLVAHAVVGLDPAQVAVVFTPKRAVELPGTPEEQPGSSPGTARLAASGLAGVSLLVGGAFLLIRRRTRRTAGRNGGRR